MDNNEQFKTVAIAPHEDLQSVGFNAVLKTVEAAGGKPLVLPMIRSYDLEYDEDGKLIWGKDEIGMLNSDAAAIVKRNTWHNSDIEKVADQIKCLILPGGVDMSSSLYRFEQPWHGIQADADYAAERDVSDYLLASYCLDNDIPVLAICRGMQVLSIVSGAQIIQDLETWYQEKGIGYTYLHRQKDPQEYVPHEVIISDQNSLLYQISGTRILTGCPSWHHQAVLSVDDTALSVTAYTMTDGIPLIEAVERKDRRFVIGVQYHPETAIRKIFNKEDNAKDYMDYQQALALFSALIEAGWN